MTTGSIDVTPGSGEQIAFDQGVTLEGGVQADLQIIKLGIGGDNEYRGFLSGRSVDSTTDEAASYVEERPDVAEYTTTLSIDTTAYTAGDQFGEVQLVMGAAKGVGGGVRIDGITVVDNDAESPEIDILFFNDLITGSTDGTTFDPTDAELLNFRAGVSIVSSDWSVFNDNAVAYLPNLNFNIPVLVTGEFYFVCVIRSADTFTASTDITIQIAYTRL